MENVSNVMINWFDENYLKANFSRFTFILFNKSFRAEDTGVFHINGVNILAQNVSNYLVLLWIVN